MIRIHENLFCLETEGVSYAVYQDEYPRNLYFGRKIHFEDICTLVQSKSHSSFDHDLNLEHEEYGFWNGFSFMESCLKLRYPGIRKLDVCFLGAETAEDKGIETLRLKYKNSYSELYVTLVYEVFPKLDLIKRYAVVENQGETAVLENAKSAAVCIPPRDNFRLRYLTGKWAGESQLTELRLNTGAFTLQSKRGNSGPHMNPSFALDDGTATENGGEVWFGLLAYTGNWQIIFEKTVFNALRVTCGISSFDFEVTLEKGDGFTTPPLVCGFSGEGYGGMSRKLHEYELTEHALPAPRKPGRILYNSWEATGFDVTAEGQKQLAKRAAEIGVELFCIDDGWFGARNSDRAGLGDWTVNTDKLPGGLEEIIRYVKSLGMDFGIWVEPESVNPDSDLYRAHPDWIYRFENQEPIQLRNQYTLNISKPEVKAFILDFMIKLLTEHPDISFIKWDMNRTLNDVSAGDSQRDKALCHRHIEALYQIWDELRRRFPGVEFESCSGGGARVDLGLLAYSDECWPSDNTDAYDRLFIQEGFSYFYAPRLMMCWVTDASSHDPKKFSRPYSYRFHSAMAGSLGIGADIRLLSDDGLREFARYIALYKEIRETVQFGRLYRLRSPRDGVLSALQYISRDGSEVLVLAFLRGQVCWEPVPTIKLCGLEPDARYEWEGRSLHGAALMNAGIPSGLHGDFDSGLYRFRRC